MFRNAEKYYILSFDKLGHNFSWSTLWQFIFGMHLFAQFMSDLVTADVLACSLSV